jgi:hypothetical protein
LIQKRGKNGGRIKRRWIRGGVRIRAVSIGRTAPIPRGVIIRLTAISIKRSILILVWTAFVIPIPIIRVIVRTVIPIPLVSIAGPVVLKLIVQCLIMISKGCGTDEEEAHQGKGSQEHLFQCTTHNNPYLRPPLTRFIVVLLRMLIIQLCVELAMLPQGPE